MQLDVIFVSQATEYLAKSPCMHQVSSLVEIRGLYVLSWQVAIMCRVQRSYGTSFQQWVNTTWQSEWNGSWFEALLDTILTYILVLKTCILVWYDFVEMIQGSCENQTANLTSLLMMPFQALIVQCYTFVILICIFTIIHVCQSECVYVCFVQTVLCLSPSFNSVVNP